ncbi:hypothetical protein [Allokutzneria sp. NRRL B-24872]|uniref:hypothetical protein n=1 Tax=Allokutzneria sp. NRRL B-24872 TaxID=1137961 RepID=UPI001177E5BF|nr:hypothetical protein [Allokutzneria sp. NRRL B-24872]
MSVLNESLTTLNHLNESFSTSTWRTACSVRGEALNDPFGALNALKGSFREFGAPNAAFAMVG